MPLTGPVKITPKSSRADLWLALPGIILVLVAAWVLNGWATGSQAQTALLASETPMVANTALVFIVIGAGFVARAAGHRRVICAAGVFVMLFGLATSFEHLRGVNLGIDELLFRGAGGKFSGRMAVPTAVVFVFCGLNLMLLGARQPPRRLLSVCTGLVMAVAFVALCGYATGLSSAYGWGTPIHMAILTCLCLLIMSVGLLGWTLSGADYWRAIEKRLLPFFLTAGVVSVVMGVVVFSSLRLRETTTAWVAHTDKVITTINVMALRISQVESGVRGYVITGGVAYLDERESNIREAREKLNELQVLVSDNPTQSARVLALIPDVQSKLARNDHIYALCQAGDPVKAAAIISSQSNVDLTKELRRMTEEISTEERRLLAVRQAASDFSARQTRNVICMGGGLVLVLLGIAFIIVRLNTRVRRQVEKALRTSEEEFRNAFEFAGIGMAIVGIDGRFTRVNATLCDLTGYEEAALRAKTFVDITHPDDIDTDLDHRRSLLAGEVRFYHMEKRYLHRLGHVLWVRLTVSLVRDSAGTPLHFVAQIEDVTDRKQLGENLAKARDEALAASRLKSEFLANMSHEIRTPMNGMIGMSGLLMETELTADQREMGKVIQHSAGNLLNIINDILDFSKIEAGKLRIEPVEFDLREAVEETLALIAHRAHEKGVELVCDFDERLACLLLGDAGRFRQVLLNLVGNAIKFTERGEVVVQMRLVRENAGQVTFNCRVSDTGIGIAREAQPLLFQPFTQADGTTTRRFGGTGLGLAISRQLVGLMGGEIDFASEPGSGSQFWFDLTMKRCAPGLPRSGRSMPPGLSALVVDDNETNRRILVSQLRSFGIEAEALAVAARFLPRLIERRDAGTPVSFGVLDGNMPQMDGLELARQVRAHPGFADLPLIMLSSAGNLENPERIAAAQFAALLTKPVQIEQLYRSLTSIVGRQSAEPSRTPNAGWSLLNSRTGSGLRLLMAEDNRTNQAVARRILEKMGHTVDVAEDGSEALAKLAKETYDGVLMDCQMPGVDGYEATRRIRAGLLEGINPGIPIIALTAYAMADDRLKCLQAGMNDYVTKPIRPDDLHAAFLRSGLIAEPKADA